jgi:penicillin-binding protein 2
VNGTTRLRLTVIWIVVLSLVLTLGWRLYYLQVLTGSTYVAAARANQIRTIETLPSRGLILDDEGRPLAENTTDLVVSVSPETLSGQAGDGAAVLHRLAKDLGESVASLRKTIRTYNGSPYQPVPLAAYPSADVAETAKALRIQERPSRYVGVSVGLQSVRDYPYGSLASQDLGYLRPITAGDLKKKQYAGYENTEYIGVSGLEEEYQKYLRGTPGNREVTVNATGTVTGTVKTTPALSGDDVVLNLDAGVQETLENQLEAELHKARSEGQLASSAAGVVMNVHTGAVVAMASVPDFNPNEFVGTLPNAVWNQLKAAKNNYPLDSRAYQSAFPPGSTFKGSSSSAILKWGIGGATQTSYGTCPTTFYGLHNSEGDNIPSAITLQQAIEYSCDTFFYQYGRDAYEADGGERQTLAEKKLPDHQYFARMALDYGLGRPTGVDLPGETSGLIGTRQTALAYWKATRKQDCRGMTRHPTQPSREQLDSFNCHYGYLLFPGEAEDFAIGQGPNVLVSPLQLADLYATVANGGTIVEPHLAKAIVSPRGRVIKRFKTIVRGHVPVSASDLAYIRQGLYLVTHGAGGTGYGQFDPALDVGGKTGTADTCSSCSRAPISWFVGVEPISHPKYVVVSMEEYAGYGADFSAPVVSNVLDAMEGTCHSYHDQMAALNCKAGPPLLPAGQEPTKLPKITKLGSTRPPTPHPAHVSPQPSLRGGAPDPQDYAGLVAPIGAMFLRRRVSRRRSRPGRPRWLLGRGRPSVAFSRRRVWGSGRPPRASPP